MKFRLIIGGVVAGLAMMSGIAPGEKLPKADGKVSATTLPLDAETSKVKFETATFGIGWFWGPDSEFGSLKGVLRTRAGYAGGEKEFPSYYSLGNHTEVISIDYDPKVLSYADLLEIFWSAHRCDQINSSRQYMNAVFYQDEGQKKAAEQSRAAAAKKRGIGVSSVQTEILPVGKFTYAEGYHQKYYLTRYSEVRDVLTAVYKDGKSLADSTVAMRLNAYLGSGMKKDWQVFLSELPEYGLPETLEKALETTARDQLAASK
jgi:peptide-methionine (S)-S-oxide reductase